MYLDTDINTKGMQSGADTDILRYENVSAYIAGTSQGYIEREQNLKNCFLLHLVQMTIYLITVFYVYTSY